MLVRVANNLKKYVHLYIVRPRYVQLLLVVSINVLKSKDNRNGRLNVDYYVTNQKRCV
jgi:hypothetical protein